MSIYDVSISLSYLNWISHPYFSSIQYRWPWYIQTSYVFCTFTSSWPICWSCWELSWSVETSISPSTVGFNIQDDSWMTFHRPRVISIVDHYANLSIGSQAAWLRISNLLQASEDQILLLCWLSNRPLNILSLESALRPSRHCALDVHSTLLAIESALNDSKSRVGTEPSTSIQTCWLSNRPLTIHWCYVGWIAHNDSVSRVGTLPSTFIKSTREIVTMFTSDGSNAGRLQSYHDCPSFASSGSE